MRRITVPKPRSSERRPLTIPSPIYRIVHRSITSVLDEIFDPIFLPVSYGFRHWRNSHSFVLDVQGWTGVKRVVHADVQSVFTEVAHKLLLYLLKEHIYDQQFIGLIHHFLINPIETAYGTNLTNTEIGRPRVLYCLPYL